MRKGERKEKEKEKENNQDRDEIIRQRSASPVPIRALVVTSASLCRSSSSAPFCVCVCACDLWVDVVLDDADGDLLRVLNSLHHFDAAVGRLAILVAQKHDNLVHSTNAATNEKTCTERQQ